MAWRWLGDGLVMAGDGLAITLRGVVVLFL